jgi:hypothetical protein
MCTVKKDYLQGRGKKTKGGGASDDAAAAFDKGKIFDRCACWHRDDQKSRVMKGRTAHLYGIRVCSPATRNVVRRERSTQPLHVGSMLHSAAALDGKFWGVGYRV